VASSSAAAGYCEKTLQIQFLEDVLPDHSLQISQFKLHAGPFPFAVIVRYSNLQMDNSSPTFQNVVFKL
jgi:hypothetical protein